MARSLFLTLVVLACATPALAADEGALPPRHSVTYSSLLAARVNPLGLEEQLAVGYRLRLYDKPGILWRDAFVGLAFTPVLNPAQLRLGAELTVKPIAVLSLAARYSFLYWLGSFEYLQSYRSPGEEHSDSALDAGKEADENYATGGGQLQLQAQALAKVGPVVLRNDLKVFHTDADLRSGDTLFYDVTVDAMVPDAGWALTNDTDLVYLTRFGLVAGVRTSLVHAFYSESDNPNTPHVRMGPLLAYVFYDRPGSLFNKPTVLLILNWYLKHRYRTGADVSQGVPYVVLGFKFGGDLWRSD